MSVLLWRLGFNGIGAVIIIFFLLVASLVKYLD
jgi:hypothetical protein